MRTSTLTGALALAITLMPVAAHADDPNDPTMRNPAARARDRAIIRKLNQDELARTSARDAQYAEGWRAYREDNRSQGDYEAQMAAWRRAVRLCESGHYEYCAR